MSKGFSVGVAEVTAFMKVANDVKIWIDTIQSKNKETPALLYPYPILIEDCFVHMRLTVHEEHNVAMVFVSDKEGKFRIEKTPWDKLQILELKANPNSYISVAASNVKTSLIELWNVLKPQITTEKATNEKVS
jgi:hypothetical protein